MEMCVESEDVKTPVGLGTFGFGGEEERENLGGEVLKKAPGTSGEDDNNGIDSTVGSATTSESEAANEALSFEMLWAQSDLPVEITTC